MFSRIRKLFSKKSKDVQKAPLKDGQRASEAQMRREMEKIGTFNEPARDARRSHPGSSAGRI